MRWNVEAPTWQRVFAWLPVQCGREMVWLEWYWRRYCGNELGDAWEVSASFPSY